MELQVDILTSEIMACNRKLPRSIIQGIDPDGPRSGRINQNSSLEWTGYRIAVVHQRGQQFATLADEIAHYIEVVFPFFISAEPAICVPCHFGIDQVFDGVQ